MTFIKSVQVPITYTYVDEYGTEMLRKVGNFYAPSMEDLIQTVKHNQELVTK